MPRKAVDLDLLEMVLGRPPRRYPKGSPRNSLRARWIQRAAIATAALLRKNDRRVPPPPDRRVCKCGHLFSNHCLGGHSVACSHIGCTCDGPEVQG